MAYIRVLDSPEKLYIFGNKDFVEVHQGQFTVGLVSYEDWYRLLDAYNNGDSVVDAEGLTNGETFEAGKLHLSYGKVSENFMWTLKHEDGWELHMWHVTWDYIARELPSTNPSRWDRIRAYMAHRDPF